uniref:Calcitonin gene-related peptide type 1 receptor n=1 Tax=Callorhinchus milii TaxID=7868 RepID=A0A4W3JTW7_CALMI
MTGNDTDNEIERKSVELSNTIGFTREKVMIAQYECYQKIMQGPTIRQERTCSMTWDGWLCWDDTPVGTVAVQHCPDYYKDFDPSEKVTKICDEEGKWFQHPESKRIWTNYTQCNAYTKEKLRTAMNLFYLAVIGHGLSVASLLISLGIFFYFNNHCTILAAPYKSLHYIFFWQNHLHGCLLLQFVCDRGNPQALFCVFLSVQIGCKISQFIHLYLMGCNYFWMLCEGIYLHTLIVVAVFAEKQHLLWYYLLGWGFPLIPATIHAIARSIYYNDNCWISSDTFLLYIIHGPICAALLVNLFFLLNIVRVLITKLKVTHRAESNLYMKAVRATLILVPLLGIQFVLFPWKPDGQNGEEVYEYVMHILMHYQGLLVATIFCFFNGEVQAILKRHWMQYKIQFGNSLSHSEGLRSTSCTGTSITEVQGGLYNHESNSDHLNGKNFNDIEPIGLKTGETYT